MRRTKAQADQTREAVIDAAEHVFFERGVARATLEEVARAAGVTRGAVYWHFRDKLAVLLAIEERVTMPQDEIMLSLQQSDPRDAIGFLEQTIKKVFDLYGSDEQRRMQLTVLLIRCDCTDEMEEVLHRQTLTTRKLTSTLRAYFQNQVHAQVRCELDPVTLADTFTALVHGAILRWLRMPEDYPLQDYGSRVVTAFFAMLRASCFSKT